MLFNKKSLDCIAVFASTDDARYMLHGIHVEASGNLVATDGHMLGILTQGDSFEESDFPSVGQTEGAQPPFAPCTLDMAGMKALTKALPKKSRLPILDYALLDHTASNENGKAVFHVTDCDNPQRINVAKMDGNFPNYHAVMPKDEPVYRIVFDAELLERLAKAAKILCKGKGQVPVEMAFTASGLQAMTATISNGDGQILTAVVMSMKGQRAREAYGLLVPAIAEPVRSELSS